MLKKSNYGGFEGCKPRQAVYPLRLRVAAVQMRDHFERCQRETEQERLPHARQVPGKWRRNARAQSTQECRQGKGESAVKVRANVQSR